MRHGQRAGIAGRAVCRGRAVQYPRFYQNLTSAPALGRGRIYTPDVPFDPFSYQNIALATMTGFAANSAVGGYRTVGKPGYSITVPFPVSPQSAALRPGRRSRPTRADAAAILSQLVSNPANRLGPSAFAAPVTGGVR